MPKTRLAMLGLLILCLTASCVTINQPANHQPTPTPTILPDIIITANYDGKESSPIFLRNNQVIYLKWHTENGEKVWFHILTPSGKIYGFYQPAYYAGGTLSEGTCQGFNSGTTQFSPSDHNWGEGYYIFNVNTGPEDIKVDVIVEYWINDK